MFFLSKTNSQEGLDKTAPQNPTQQNTNENNFRLKIRIFYHSENTNILLRLLTVYTTPYLTMLPVIWPIDPIDKLDAIIPALIYVFLFTLPLFVLGPKTKTALKTL